MFSLRNSKKDKTAGTESKRGVGGDAIAVMAKVQIMQDIMVTNEDSGLGWDRKLLGGFESSSSVIQPF